MAPLTFSLLLTLSLLSSALASTQPFLASVADDPLIRQVVSEGAEAVDQLLHADHHFTLFKSKYSKAYATQEEHDYRFSVFKANLRRAKRHQLVDPTAVHGVTKFSDLTPEEFERTYLGLHKQRLKLPADAHEAPKLPTN
uniref:Cathepsin propeptide inhibitor domain-containing protein n=2 Tax=Eukaryota TaxID=2759 RepID=A0A8C2C8Y0_CYPCA